MRKRSTNRSGFTLAELLIVIAIMGIVAAFGFVNVIQNQRNLKRMEMDNIAGEIFVAAQNHLTESKSSGEWDRIYSLNDKTTDGCLGSQVSTGDMKKLSDYPSNVDTQDHDYRRIYYAGSGDSDKLNSDQSVLGVMLPVGATDDTVRTGGYYIIEYDAKNAQVYSVFYTDNSNGLNTSDMNTLNDCRSSSQNRTSYSNKGQTYQIGYYGGAVAENPSYDSSQDTDKNASLYSLDNKVKLTFVNGNRLLLVLDDPNPQSLLGQYTIASSQSSQNVTSYTYTVTIKIKDTEGNEATLATLTYNGGTITNSDASKEIYNTQENVFILDSIVDEGRHFKQQFPNLVAGDNITATAEIQLTWGSGSYSASETVKTETPANSLFDNATSGSSATISNARHLENLSEEVSGVSGITTATITKDIDWSSFVEAVKSEDAYGIKSDECSIYFLQKQEDGTYSSRGYESSNTYYGIVNSNLTSLTGKVTGSDDKTVSATLSNFTIEGDSRSTYAYAKSSSGLIAVSDHTMAISNLTLKNFRVNQSGGGTNAGALVGLSTDQGDTGNSTLKVSNVAVSDVTIGGNTTSATMHVGGILGAVNEGSAQITDCTLSGRNTLTGQMAGGILGRALNTEEESTLKGNTSMPSVLIDSCTVEGNSLNVTATQYAGGIIGQYSLLGADGWSSADAGSIVNTKLSATTIEIMSGQLDDGSEKAYAAGGFIGDLTDATSFTVTSCMISDAENGTVTIRNSAAKKVSRQDAGGLIGAIRASGTSDGIKVTINNTSIERSGSTFAIKSGTEGNVGGFIGSIYAPKKKNGDNKTVTITDCNVNSQDLQIEASNAASGAVGSCEYIALQVSDCSVSGGQNGKVHATAGNAGGFIANLTTGRDASFTACSSNLLVEAQNIAGGFAGNVENNDKSSVSFDQCYILGRTAEGKYQDSSYNVSGAAVAGGFAGDLKGTISISYSFTTASVGGSSSVGGFAGKAEGTSATIKNCYATGTVLDNNSNSGLFIGTVSNKVAGKSNYVLRRYQVNTKLVGNKKNDAVQTLVKAVYPTDTTVADNPFQIDKNMQAQGQPYDTSLIDPTSMKALYPYATTDQLKNGKTNAGSKLIAGDWPVPDQTPRILNTMVLYYEVVEDRSEDPSRTYYFYHGLLMDPNDETKNVVHEVQAAYDENGNSLSNELTLDPTTGLVSVSETDKYVIDDGYLFVINSNVPNDSANTLASELLKHVKIVKDSTDFTTPYQLYGYDAEIHTEGLLAKLHLNSAYVYEMSYTGKWDWLNSQLRLLISDQDISNQRTYNSAANASTGDFQFGFCPYYGDCFSTTPNAFGNLQIRSVRQLVLGMQNDHLPKSYTSNKTDSITQTRTIAQTMDLDMRDLTAYQSRKQVTSSRQMTSPIATYWYGTYTGTRGDGSTSSYHKICYLSQKFIQNVYGSVEDLDFESPTSNLFYSVGGSGTIATVQNIVVNGATVNTGTDRGLITNYAKNKIKINDITITNSATDTSGIVGQLQYIDPTSSISNITLQNDKINQNGVVASENKTAINTVQINNCTITGNGICNYNSGSISDVNIGLGDENSTDKCTVQYGICSNNYGSISNVVIRHSNINRCGICEENKSTIAHVEISNSNITSYGICTYNGKELKTGAVIGGSAENPILFENCSIGNAGVCAVNYAGKEISFVEFRSCDIKGNGISGPNSGKLENNTIESCKIGNNGLCDSNEEILNHNVVTNTEIGQNGFCKTNSATISNNNFSGCTYTNSTNIVSLGVFENTGLDAEISNNQMLGCRINNSNASSIVYNNNHQDRYPEQKGVINNNKVTFAMYNENTPSKIGVGCCKFNSRASGSGIIEKNTIDGHNAVFTISGFIYYNCKSGTVRDNVLSNITSLGPGFCNENWGTISGNTVSGGISSGVGFVNSNQSTGVIYQNNIINPNAGQSGCVYYNQGKIYDTHVYGELSSDELASNKDSNPAETYQKCKIGFQISRASCAGFCVINSGIITGCSFEGSVYGSPRADGFFDQNSGIISGSYANAQLYQKDANKNSNSVDAGCYGFGATSSTSGSKESKVENCFSIVTMTNGYDPDTRKSSGVDHVTGNAGFIGQVKGTTSVTGCYSIVCNQYGEGQTVSNAVTAAGNDPFILFTDDKAKISGDSFWNGENQYVTSDSGVQGNVEGNNSAKLVRRANGIYMIAKSYTTDDTTTPVYYPYPGLYTVKATGESTNVPMYFYGCWPIDASASSSDGSSGTDSNSAGSTAGDDTDSIPAGADATASDDAVSSAVAEDSAETP